MRDNNRKTTMFTKPHPRRICLTFDAFGTLFHPHEPIGKQYADVARRYGLSGFTDEEMGASFRKGNLETILWPRTRDESLMCLGAFKKHSEEKPNYGKAVGMSVEKWWGDVSDMISLCFRCPLLKRQRMRRGAFELFAKAWYLL